MKQHYTSLPSDITKSIKDGSVLAGDNYSLEQIKTWFAQEQEAYYEGDSGNGEIDPWYTYMRFENERLGFPYIEKMGKKSGRILLLGPGPATEIERFYRDNPDWSLYFLEASNNFKLQLQKKFPQSVLIEPTIVADINLENDSLDAICAFSVLHHIPNVSKVIQEAYRVLGNGGILLVREPCSSMGDWRYARSATPNERGISRKLLIKMATEAGFELVTNPIPILFEPINKILKKTIGYTFISFRFLYVVDRIISWLVAPNDSYWRDKWYKKIAPGSYFIVFRKE